MFTEGENWIADETNQMLMLNGDKGSFPLFWSGHEHNP